MPRVLRLTPHFYWPQLAKTGWPVKFDSIGGMQTQIYRQALALSQLGINQTILTLKVPGAPEVWDIDERTKVVGVRIPVMPIRSRLRGMLDLNLSWVLGVLLHIARSDESYDIVHCHWSGVGFPPWLSTHLKQRLALPSLATVHCSSIATYHAMSGWDHVQHWAARRIEEQALKRLDAIITLTPRTCGLLAEAIPSLAGRIHVVPDCIDSGSFSGSVTAHDIDQFRTQYAVPQGLRVVGYVGRVAREKGWRGLLEMAQTPDLADAFFLVVGDGNERDLMEEEIFRCGLTSRFCITGYIPNDRIPVALKACDVVVLPSRHEEFGSVLLEAMSVGVPCIAFRIGGVPHVLAEGRAGRLIDDGDYKAMARGVRELFEQPQEIERLVRYAADHVIAHFSEASSARALAQIYSELSPE